MALLAKSEEFIILTAQRIIFVWNTKDSTHTLTQVPQIPRKKVENNGNVADNNGDKPENDENEDETKQSNVEFGDINRLAVSPCNRLISVTTTGDKFVFIYRFNSGILSLLQSKQLGRATSVIKFTPDSKQLLIADKTGDCSILDCQTEQQNEAKWILGHLSMVLDVLMSNDLKYVISSDRDEKIRVTNYPLTEVVESYCLGHTEFVTSIDELKTETNENILVSVSGDQTIRLWNYVEGKELFRQDLPARGLRLTKNAHNQIAVVSFDDKFTVNIFEFSVNGSQPVLRSLAEHTLNENVKYIGSIIYELDNKIWITGLNENNEPILKQLDVIQENDKINIVETNLDNILNVIKQNLTSTKLQPCEDIATLFKSRIDNTADYHERKRQRIEKRYAKFH